MFPDRIRLVLALSPTLLINFAVLSKRAAAGWLHGLISSSAFDVSPGRGRVHWRNSEQRPAIAYCHAALGRALLCPLFLHGFSFNSSSVTITQQRFKAWELPGPRPAWAVGLVHMGPVHHGQVRVLRTAGLSGCPAPLDPETAALQGHR